MTLKKPDLITSPRHYNEVPSYCIGKSVLDLGSSNGCGAYHSKHRDLFNDYLGVDVQGFDKCCLPVIQSNIFDFKSDRKYDTVLALHVIEHFDIELWPKFFDIVDGLLKPNGYLVVNVPYRQKVHVSVGEFMEHKVLNIDETLLSRFLDFKRYIKIKQWRKWAFRNKGESFLWATARLVFRILTNHKYSFLKRLYARSQILIAIYWKEREELVQIGDVDDLEEAYGDLYKEREE